MKSSIIAISIILTVADSAIAAAQTNEPEKKQSTPPTVLGLKSALKSADNSKRARNSVLCLERDEFYYNYQANWVDKVIGYAQRGKLLVELHQRSVERSGVYRPEQATNQQTAFRENHEF